MNERPHVALFLCLLSLPVIQAPATFSSLWAFGDGLCTTTNNAAPAPFDVVYYGNRYCNGRVWIEVLAQWQGVPYEARHNWSYYGHDSGEMVAHVAQFIPPADAATALFIVWANNADFVELMSANSPPYSQADVPVWSDRISQSLLNHRTILTNLYHKGVRTMILPNAADVTHVPFFGMPQSDRDFVRARIQEFNRQFLLLLDNVAASNPGLTIYQPDSFALMDDVVLHPAKYGITKVGIDAITDLWPPALDGPGGDYAFWDDIHPSAKLQMHLAELVQEILSPVALETISPGNGTHLLSAVNVPIGRGGMVEGSTNIPVWTTLLPFSSTNTTQTIPVPASGPVQFYRLRFPFNWAWP